VFSVCGRVSAERRLQKIDQPTMPSDLMIKSASSLITTGESSYIFHSNLRAQASLKLLPTATRQTQKPAALPATANAARPAHSCSANCQHAEWIAALRSQQRY
jgi:hypothetical protein